MRVELGRLREESSRADSNEPIRSRLDCLFSFASQFCPNFVMICSFALKNVFFTDIEFLVICIAILKKVTIRRKIFGEKSEDGNQRFYDR